MSEVNSLEDSEESLDDHTGGIHNVFSVDQLVALSHQQREEEEEEGEDGHSSEGEGLEAQYSLSFSSNTEASPSNHSCSRAGLSNLHDIDELTALSSLVTVEEEVNEEEEEDVEEDYSLDDFEPADSDGNDEERTSVTATSSMHTPPVHGRNQVGYFMRGEEEEEEDEKEEEHTWRPDHFTMTHCCSVSVQTDPVPNFKAFPHAEKGGGGGEGGWSHILGQHSMEGVELQVPHKDLLTPLPAAAAMTTISPTNMLHHLISSQLQLTQQLMGQTLQLARSLTSTITPSYHYTTLQETKQYIDRHKPRVLSLSEAKKLIYHSPDQQ